MLADKWLGKSAEVVIQGNNPRETVTTWIGKNQIFFPKQELVTMLAPKLPGDSPEERSQLIGFQFKFHQWTLQITDADESGYLAKRLGVPDTEPEPAG